MSIESEINWTTLHRLLTEDLARYQQFARNSADHPQTAKYFEGLAEGTLRALQCMTTLAGVAPSVPGLAEHTAAACDTIIEAGR